MEKDTLVKVVNRDNGSLIYSIPDLGIRRRFSAGEEKEVTFDELKKLSYITGGDYILQHCLLIEDENAVSALLGDVEPEYFYSEADVRNLLANGSVDELLDCLDFAPIGVIEMVKSIAVETRLNDLAKRQAILNKTNFDVTNAIMINDETSEENEPTTSTGRRVAIDKKVKNEENVEGVSRRTATPKYKVVSSSK